LLDRRGQIAFLDREREVDVRPLIFSACRRGAEQCGCRDAVVLACSGDELLFDLVAAGYGELRA
jgi:hypothetical protein